MVRNEAEPVTIRILATVTFMAFSYCVEILLFCRSSFFPIFSGATLWIYPHIFCMIGDGVLNFVEFVDLMFNEKVQIDEDLELIEAFRSFDSDDNGKLLFL